MTTQAAIKANEMVDLRDAAETFKARPLREAQIKLAQFVTQRFAVVLDPASTPYESVFDPAFWANVSSKMQQNDIVEVHADDGSYFAELYVRSAHKSGARMHELRHVELASKAEEAPVGEPLTVERKGPIRKWCVMRGAEYVEEGFQTKEEAQEAVARRSREFAA